MGYYSTADLSYGFYLSISRVKEIMEQRNSEADSEYDFVGELKCPKRVTDTGKEVYTISFELVGHMDYEHGFVFGVIGLGGSGETDQITEIPESKLKPTPEQVGYLKQFVEDNELPPQAFKWMISASYS